MTQEAQATIDGTLSASRLTADLYETPGGEAYVVEVQVPGLKPEEIVIEADSYSLTVATEPREESSGSRRYITREQSVRPMSRIFDFPDEIDVDNIRTSLEHGVLVIRVPKAGASRRKIIRLSSAALPPPKGGGRG
ncbi:MAG TPA: Hsp20/alpha crystallin family protein [Nitrospira sp.]|nr:Hsp20/alpha crystallin family protein [Nitrospira sp.]